jgi:heat shock protein HslJ
MRRASASARRLAVAVLAVLVAAACTSAPSPDVVPDVVPATLAGSTWRLVTVDGREPVRGREPTVEFSVDRVQGSGGCNDFGGTYRLAAGEIRIGQLQATAMGCPEAPVMEIEAAFMQALAGGTRASVDEAGRLVIESPGHRVVLDQNPAPADPPASPGP